jgi:hypothetical protein
MPDETETETPAETEEPESEGGETDEPQGDTAEYRVSELLKTDADQLDPGPLSEVFDQDRVEWPAGRNLDHEPAGHTAETTPEQEEP